MIISKRFDGYETTNPVTGWETVHHARRFTHSNGASRIYSFTRSVGPDGRVIVAAWSTTNELVHEWVFPAGG